MNTEAFKSEQMKYARLMYAVMDELKRANAKFPNQSFEWGGGPGRFWILTGPLGTVSQIQRAIVDAQAKEGTSTWFDVIAEEFLEAGAESGRASDTDLARLGGAAGQAAHERLKAELIQTAAMCLRAVADLDRRREEQEQALSSVARGESVAEYLNRSVPNATALGLQSIQMPPLVPRGPVQPGDLGYKGEHPLDRAQVPDGFGKHSGNCQCKACAEPDPTETIDITDGDGTVLDVINIPPNAGSAE